MKLKGVFMIVALVLFAIGSSTRWWGEAQRPYFPAVVSLGLFFATLSFIWQD